MSLVLYPKFYKQTGIRQSNKIKNPRASLIKDILLPKNSYLHFCDHGDDSELTLGIEENNPFLTNLPKTSKAVMFHQTDYSENIDLSQYNVMRRTLQKALLIKEYHRDHPEFVKGFIDRNKANLQTNLVVKNHTLVGADYNYVKNVLADYNRLHNYWKSVLDDIGKTILTTTRHHFLPIRLPDVIPSRSQLSKWETESKAANWRKLGTEERYLFAEFYSWLKQEGNSIFPLEDKVLARLNIIFYHKYFYYVVNLGMLKSWIIPSVGKTEDSQELTANDARRYFLLGAIKIVMNTVVADPDNENEEEESDESNTINIGNVDADDEDYSVDSEEGFEESEAEKAQERQLYQLDLDKARNEKGITSVQELLKIGQEKGATKVLSAKETEDIFNSEQAEENDDEDALAALETLNENQERKEEKIEILKEVGYQSYKPQELDLSTTIDEKADELITTGKYSTAEIRRFKTIGRKWENIKDPNGSNKSAPEVVNINQQDYNIEPEKTKLAESVNGVLEESMLSSSLTQFDKKYVKEIMPRHMMAIGVNLQRAGICVTDYKVTKFENAFDAYEIHSFKLIPLEGGESTIKVKVPIVQEDGTFVASSVKSRLRIQRIDVPIRKISHHQVALTSYVSKFFVTRSDLVAYSQERWLEKQLIGISNDNPNIKINFSNCYRFDTFAPVKYTILSRIVAKIETDNYVFNFDATKLTSMFGGDLIKEIEKSNKNQIVVGKNKKKNTILLMVEDGTIFECSTENIKDIQALGTIESLLGLDVSKSPVDMLSVNISGKELPLVFVLGYYLGLGNLLTTLGAKFERHPKGSRISLENEQYAVKFADETLVFDRKDYRTAIVMGGFRQIKDIIKNYSVYEFDLKDVYGTILLDMKISARYTRELDLMRDLWVDPISRDVLKQMGEPTDFVQLLLRAADMLVIDQHKETRDEEGFRLRGYERFSGFAYKEMVDAVRVHNNKPSKANSKVEVNPQAVWMKILQDQTTAPVEDSNPIHSLKEQEIVVYRGAGGRDARTLNSESRKYHENSIGVLSDATVDNGDAGTVVYLTADPNITSVLGMTKIANKEERGKLPPTKLFATSSLLAPGIEFDD